MKISYVQLMCAVRKKLVVAKLELCLHLVLERALSRSRLLCRSLGVVMQGKFAGQHEPPVSSIDCLVGRHFRYQ